MPDYQTRLQQYVPHLSAQRGMYAPNRATIMRCTSLSLNSATTDRFQPLDEMHTLGWRQPRVPVLVGGLVDFASGDEALMAAAAPEIAKLEGFVARTGTVPSLVLGELVAGQWHFQGHAVVLLLAHRLVPGVTHVAVKSRAQDDEAHKLALRRRSIIHG